jgi:glycosyltransferase involved in cell wall biosynthesis
MKQRPSGDSPGVCVIVPCYNEEETIGECLEALKSQTHSISELIVVDDASTDNSPMIVRHKGVRLIRLKENSGVARARNLGIRKTEAEIVAFTDSDCVVERQWLEELIKAMKSKNLDVVMGKILTPLNAENFIVIAQTGGKKIKEVKEESLGGGYSVAYKRKVFQQLGGFDERFRRGCEFEFNLRVLESRFKFGWAENAVVKFSYASNIRQLWNQEFSNGFWSKKIMRAHPSFIRRRIKYMLGRGVVIILPILYICFLLREWRDYDSLEILWAEGATTFLRFLAYYSGLFFSIVRGMSARN